MSKEDSNGLGHFVPDDVDCCAMEWEEYKYEWDVVADSKGYYLKQGRQQVGFLLKCMGIDHIKSYNSFVWAPAQAAVVADEANGIEAQAARLAEDKFDLKTVKSKFDELFGTEKFRSIKRQEFFSLDRGTMNLVKFVGELKLRAKYCGFDDKEDGLIMDLVINKGNDADAAEKLMQLPNKDVTFNNIKQICRQVETVNTHVRKMKMDKKDNTVHKATPHASGGYHRGSARGAGSRGSGGHRGYRGRSGSHRGGGGGYQGRDPYCDRCNRHHDPSYCRAANEYCGACGQRGHYKKSPRCRENQSHSQSQGYSRGRGHGRGRARGYRGQGHPHNVHLADNYAPSHYGGADYEDYEEYELSEQFDSDLILDSYVSDVVYDDHVVSGHDYDHVSMFEKHNVDDVVEIFACNDVKDNDWTVEVKVGNDCMRLEIDTGAKCNVINMATLQSLGRYQLQPSRVSIRGVHGQCVKAIGMVQLPCSYKNITRSVEFQVLGSQHPVNILGRFDCVRFGLIARVNVAQAEGAYQGIRGKFKDVLGNNIGCLPGEYSIKIDPSVPPVVHPPRPVPAPIREDVRRELDDLERRNIIAKVTEPTDWVNSMVNVRKKTGRVRVCIDPTELNRAIMREHHPMRSIDDVATRLSGSTIYSILDANKGFFHIKLTEESSYLTTFNTPFGRYRYLRLPMGVKSAGEVYQREMEKHFGELEGVEIVVDDILVHGPNREVHDRRLTKVLEKAREINLQLNENKCKFGKTEVDYVGHKLTGDGLKPTKERIKAITEMASPQSFQELETVLGMLAYVAKFIPNLSQLNAPLRELKTHDEWTWTDEHQQAFEQVKKMLVSTEVLKYYDVHKPVKISVDASMKGLGAAILQEDGVVAYASRALTPTEQRYAQIEKEMLAILFGCSKFHKFIYGKRDVTIETDHKPLENLMKKPIHAAPMRIQRMMLKLQPYEFTLVHISGKKIGLADCLSRLPLQGTGADEQLVDEELMVCKVDSHAYKRHDEIAEETNKDKAMQKLKKVILEGWPENKSEVHHDVAPYWDFREELSTYNGVVYKGERVCIPSSLRQRMLKSVHSAHMGMIKSKQRARDVIYWPGMNKQIEEVTSKCPACLERRDKQQKEPLQPHTVPELPWNKVGVDLFEHNGSSYIVFVDYFSNFIEFAALSNTRTTSVIREMKKMIARYGIMEEIISDNGPQFSSTEFASFTEAYNIQHMTSSPEHQQANGLAENAVKIIKNTMKKCEATGDDFYLAMLDVRNTPRDDTTGSPMQRLMGRRARTRLPIAETLLKPQNLDGQKVAAKMQQLRAEQKRYYDKGARPLPTLQEGDAVRIRTPQGWEKAEYVQQHSPNSHIVKAGSHAKTYRRNRTALLKTKEDQHTITPQRRPRVPIPMWNGPRQVTQTPNRQQPPPVPSPPRPAVIQQPDAQGRSPAPIQTRSGRVVKRPAHLREFVTP